MKFVFSRLKKLSNSVRIALNRKKEKHAVKHTKLLAKKALERKQKDEKKLARKQKKEEARKAEVLKRKQDKKTINEKSRNETTKNEKLKNEMSNHETSKTEKNSIKDRNYGNEKQADRIKPNTYSKDAYNSGKINSEGSAPSSVRNTAGRASSAINHNNDVRSNRNR